MRRYKMAVRFFQSARAALIVTGCPLAYARLAYRERRVRELFDALRASNSNRVRVVFE